MTIERNMCYIGIYLYVHRLTSTDKNRIQKGRKRKEGKRYFSLPFLYFINEQMSQTKYSNPPSKTKILNEKIKNKFLS